MRCALWFTAALAIVSVPSVAHLRAESGDFSVVVYGVSAGRSKAEFLRDLTSFSGGRLFEIDKTANLSATFLSILEEFRRRYLVSYTPRGVSKDGWHRLEVRIKGKRATVKARPGYLAGPG